MDLVFVDGSSACCWVDNIDSLGEAELNFQNSPFYLLPCNMYINTRVSSTLPSDRVTLKWQWSNIFKKLKYKKKTQSFIPLSCPPSTTLQDNVLWATFRITMWCTNKRHTQQIHNGLWEKKCVDTNTHTQRVVTNQHIRSRPDCTRLIGESH